MISRSTVSVISKAVIINRGAQKSGNDSTSANSQVVRADAEVGQRCRGPSKTSNIITKTIRMASSRSRIIVIGVVWLSAYVEQLVSSSPGGHGE